MRVGAFISRWFEWLPEPVARRLRPLIGSDLAHKVAETFATRIVMILIGVATGALIARSLGPEGRGIQATIAATVAIGVQFGNLGLHASSSYHVVREPRLLGSVVANNLFMSLGVGTGLVIVAGAVFRALPRIAPVHGVYLVLALASIPVSLCLMLLRDMLPATNHVRELNTSDLIAAVANMVALGVVIAVGAVSVESVVLVGLAGSAVLAVWTGRVLLRGCAAPLRPSFSTLRRQLGYGFKKYLASLFMYTLLRADILMCSSILGAEPTGQYSIAVAMANLVFMLASAAGDIAFPRLTGAANTGERWSRSLTIAKWITLALVGLSIPAAILARPAVSFLYGAAFLPSVPAFLWLLPGIVMLGTNTIFMITFGSEGMPAISLWSPLMAATVNIFLNSLLIPRFGIIGAAIASTAAYSLLLATSLVYIRATGRWPESAGTLRR